MSDNPFLLPPGGGKTPAAGPPPAGPPTIARPAVPDPTHYIAVPASVESATHRIVRAPSDETVAEETRLVAPTRVGDVAPSGSPALQLILPDGARLRLDGALLLGRDPAAIPERPDARLLAVVDLGKTVSKTHALLEPAPEGVRVRDLHSTNGVAIDTASGRQLLSAGGEAIAPSGATIMLGSFAIRVTS